ncbi:hypothetical protein Plhal304r1_c002g0006471 [Plasmopara halstedii]
MFRRNTSLAVFIAVIAVQVVSFRNISAEPSICNKAEECYVDGSSSNLCNRSEKKCDRCISEMESDSLWTTIGFSTNYACYAFNDDGDCPYGTTKCSAKMQASETTETTETTETYENSTQGSDAKGTFVENSLQSNLSANSSRMNNKSSTFSDLNESTASSILIPKNKKVTLTTPDTSSSGSMLKSPTLKPIQMEPEESEYEQESPESSTSDSKGDVLESDTIKTDETGNGYSAVQHQIETRSAKNVMSDRESVSATVAPVIPKQSEEALVESTPVERKADRSNMSSGNNSSVSNQMGLIIGVVGGAVVLIAVAGFVAWKRKDEDDDSDDDDSAFSPTKPAANQGMAAPYSASNATTAYSTNATYPSQPPNDAHNYGNQYSNPYNNKNYDGGSYANNYHGNSSNQYPVPSGYGSPGSIDMDDEQLRRTDSILGGTGVMLSTKTGGAPFALSGGPSPTYSDASDDARDKERKKTRHKRTSSVEF